MRSHYPRVRARLCPAQESRGVIIECEQLDRDEHFASCESVRHLRGSRLRENGHELPERRACIGSLPATSRLGNSTPLAKINAFVLANPEIYSHRVMMWGVAICPQITRAVSTILANSLKASADFFRDHLNTSNWGACSLRLLTTRA
jgi:hypothetical protein